MHKALHVTAFTLVIIGGLNWLLVGLFSWDIGEIFGGMNVMASRVIYVLVGLSAVYLLATHKKSCRECGTGAGSTMNSGGAPRV